MKYLESGFYNADCMEAMKEFPDNFFDIAVVDTVYGGVTQGGYMYKCGGRWIGGGEARFKLYDKDIWLQEKTDADYFEELFRVSKNQIIWGGNYFADVLPVSQGWRVWDKLRAEGVTYADCELAWTSFDRATRIFRFKWDGMLQGDMKNKEARIHPTQKPIHLYNYIIKNYIQPGDKVLDTHVGSASSLIAYHRAGLDYWGFEISPNYYRDAKKRLDDEKAQLSLLAVL